MDYFLKAAVGEKSGMPASSAKHAGRLGFERQEADEKLTISNEFEIDKRNLTSIVGVRESGFLQLLP